MWGQLAFVFVFKRHYCNPVKRILTLENVYQLKTSHCKAKALCMPACVIFSCRTEHPLLLQPCNYRPFSPSQTRHHLLEPSHHHQRAPWCSPPMLQSFLIIHYRVHHLTRDYDYMFSFLFPHARRKRGVGSLHRHDGEGGRKHGCFYSSIWLIKSPGFLNSSVQTGS